MHTEQTWHACFCCCELRHAHTNTDSRSMGWKVILCSQLSGDIHNGKLKAATEETRVVNIRSLVCSCWTLKLLSWKGRVISQLLIGNNNKSFVWHDKKILLPFFSIRLISYDAAVIIHGARVSMCMWIVSRPSNQFHISIGRPYSTRTNARMSHKIFFVLSFRLSE